MRVELKVESGLGASLGSLIMPYGPKAGDHFGDHELWMGAKKFRRRLRAVGGGGVLEMFDAIMFNFN